MIGPMITTALQIDITCGICRCGKMSSITVCESGISEAPAMPCRKRKPTISGRFCATPQAIEVRVKVVIEISSIGLRPIFSDSQPDSGVMIAVARM